MARVVEQIGEDENAASGKNRGFRHGAARAVAAERRAAYGIWILPPPSAPAGGSAPLCGITIDEDA